MTTSAFLPVQHDTQMVLGAFLVAFCASYVTLELSRRVRGPDPAAARIWGMAGAVVMGTGIWAMHFVAMLGFEAGIPLGYALGPTALSWLAAVAAAAVALRLAMREHLDTRRLLAGATVMAGGICAMHYIGMSALDLAPGIVWNWAWVAVSIAVAWVASAAAMAIIQGLRRLRASQRRRWQCGASLVMGVAISGMHYAGMAAVDLPLGTVCRSLDGLSGHGVAGAVVLTALLLIGITLLTSAHDATMHARERALSTSLRTASSELEQAQARLRRQALEDPLTGLANRALFEDRLAHAAARLDRSLADARGKSPQTSLAVVLINLDGFKPLNDSYGHTVGDRLLATVAQRLAGEARASDTLARVGGDEFVMLLEGLDGEGEALMAAERLLAAAQSPVESVLDADGTPLTLSASVGVVLYPQGEPADRLLGCAGAALQVAKRGGGGSCALYEAAMAGDAAEQVAIAQALRHAAERGELALHYQPKVDAATGRLHGVEALLRWRHPQRGPVSPAVFIPVAERFGLIGPIGNWVIDEGCAQLARWRDAGLVTHMAINLSAHQLRQPDLIERIRHALQRHDLDPSRLICELTESSMMEDVHADRMVLDALIAEGVALSIDDFGTGYSSLAYLRRLPVRQLKIDRSLVQDVDRDTAAHAVMDAVVRLAHALGLAVVAEGVETESQRLALVRMRCDLLQGFLLGRPMPADDLPGWIARQAASEVAPAAVAARVAVPMPESATGQAADTGVAVA